MAQYVITPNELPTGTPSGWTRYINSTGTLTVAGGSPQTLALASTTAGTKVFGYDALNGVTDNIEILVKFQLSSATGKQGIASLRYSGSSEATTKGYTLSGSFISGAGTLAIDEGSTGYVSWTAWNYLAGVTYWARFRVDGNRIRGKVWTDGSSEPAWMLDSTDSNATTGSFNGLHDYGTGTISYYNVSFGTAGDTAPTQANKTQTGNVNIVRPAYTNGYYYRKKYTANTSQLTTTSLTGTVGVINVVDANLKSVANGGHIYNTGSFKDILLTDSSDTPIPMYIESYDPTTGALVIWYKKDMGNSASAASARQINMYYGKLTMSSSNESNTAVWGSYQSAMVMNGTIGGGTEMELPDSQTWGVLGTDAAGASTKIGKSRSLSGGNLYKNNASKYLIAQNNTISMWIRFKSLPPNSTAFAWPLYQVTNGGSGDGGTGANGAFRLDNQAGVYRFNVVKYAIVDQYVTWSSPSTNTWYYITAVVSTTDTKYYVNGSLIGSFSNSSAFNTSTARAGIGYPTSTSQGRPDADIDYFYKIGAAKSADELLTEYRNQNDTPTFFGIGSEELPYSTTDNTQVGNVRITQTTSQTQVGNVRISRTTSQTQSGNVRITATTSRNQLGNIRIRQTVSRTQLGNVRIRRTNDKIQTGNIRITRSTSRTQSGSVWIGSPPVNRTQVGNVNIRNNTSRTQTGNVRIRQTVSRTQIGNIRIRRTNDKIQVGNVRIATAYLKTQVGNVRIRQAVSRNQIGNIRIRVTNDRNQVGSVVVAREYFRDQIGNVRIVAGIDYRVKPVAFIVPEKPKMTIHATKPTGRAESITGLVTSEKIMQNINIDSDKPVIRNL